MIKRLLASVFGGPDGKQLVASIMDEQPAGLKLVVNGRYPDAVPVSTVPPEILQTLPKLTEDLEYRFIGRHLILLDTHAHVIVDFIENAMRLFSNEETRDAVRWRPVPIVDPAAHADGSACRDIGIASDAAASKAAEPAVPLPNKQGSFKFAVLGDSGSATAPRTNSPTHTGTLDDRFEYGLVILVGDNLDGSERPQDLA